MNGLIKEIINTLLHNQNQFASGGMLLMLLGSIGALFRSIPTRIWAWVVHQTTISLVVTDDNFEFDWLRKWMETQRIMKKSRHIDIATRGYSRWSPNAKTILAPAPGHHWMWHHRPISIKSERQEDTKSGNRKESIVFTTIGRDQNFFRRMIEEISKHKSKEAPQPQLYFWGQDSWVEIQPYRPRSLDSVFFPGELKEDLVRDIKKFKDSYEWYSDLGIPYHRGYLFEGPPGTGKTSLVIGLSHKFNARVYVLKISEMSDSTLRTAVSDMEPDSFAVMEDIDCISLEIAADRKKKKTENKDEKKDGVVEDKDTKVSLPMFGVSLSGLLNIIDGLSAPSGVMFFMTTNHVEKLDAALIRPGRIDVRKHIGEADEKQKRAMYNAFFPGVEIPETYLQQTLTMAELQQILMEERNKVN